MKEGWKKVVTGIGVTLGTMGVMKGEVPEKGGAIKDKTSEPTEVNAQISEPVILGRPDTKKLSDTEKTPFKKAFFLEALKREGLVDTTLTQEEFEDKDKFPEEKMKELSLKYKEARGAVTEDELPKDKKYETIERIRYGLKEGETVTIEEALLIKEKSDFEAWYAKQPEGTTQTYQGRKIKIDRSGKAISAGEKPNPEPDVASSSTEETEKFIYLKDRDYNK